MSGSASTNPSLLTKTVSFDWTGGFQIVDTLAKKLFPTVSPEKNKTLGISESLVRTRQTLDVLLWFSCLFLEEVA
jgi:hypothetical protein